METFWKGIKEFFATASADLALKLVATALMLFVGFKLIKLLMKLLGRSLSKSKLDASLQGFLENMVSILLKVMLVISLLMYLGVPAASFIAILTSAGLAIGLALQGSLSNFAGGLMIMFFRPFKAGDFITSGDSSGVVQQVSIMYTTLKTLDGKKVVIPNSLLSNGIITDATWYEKRRVEINFGTDTEQDVGKVTELILSLAKAHPQVLADPAPAAYLDNSMQDGRLTFALRCWAKTPQWWQTTLDLTRAIKEALGQNNIALSAPVQEYRQH